MAASITGPPLNAGTAGSNYPTGPLTEQQASELFDLSNATTMSIGSRRYQATARSSKIFLTKCLTGFGDFIYADLL